MEVEEVLALFGPKLAKTNNKTTKLISLCLSSPGPNFSTTGFVGREIYKQKLENQITSDLGNLPQGRTHEDIANCIKTFTNLHALVGGTLLETRSSKYGMLTRM